MRKKYPFCPSRFARQGSGRHRRNSALILFFPSGASLIKTMCCIGFLILKTSWIINTFVSHTNLGRKKIYNPVPSHFIFNSFPEIQIWGLRRDNLKKSGKWPMSLSQSEHTSKWGIWPCFPNIRMLLSAWVRACLRASLYIWIPLIRFTRLRSIECNCQVAFGHICVHLPHPTTHCSLLLGVVSLFKKKSGRLTTNYEGIKFLRLFYFCPREENGILSHLYGLFLTSPYMARYSSM
jgi:hypothetical protein